MTKELGSAFEIAGNEGWGGAPVEHKERDITNIPGSIWTPAGPGV